MTLRKDLALVASLIPAGSRVLDLGCASGQLLSHLMNEQGCRGTGVEIDSTSVLAAIRLGIPVIELDLDLQLDDFADDSYDVVVLSRTIQTIRRPQEVLRQMGRIGRRLIVSVPNFGWYGHRLRLLRGRMPMSRELPYEWYNTPNLRHTTLVDLQLLFDELGFTVEQRITLTPAGDPLQAGDRLANLMAGAAVYVLRPSA
ncbi:MAG: methionine biosynthesis protein MetW [Propionicimonas sp.]